MEAQSSQKKGHARINTVRWTWYLPEALLPKPLNEPWYCAMTCIRTSAGFSVVVTPATMSSSTERSSSTIPPAGPTLCCADMARSDACLCGAVSPTGSTSSPDAVVMLCACPCLRAASASNTSASLLEDEPAMPCGPFVYYSSNCGPFMNNFFSFPPFRCRMRSPGIRPRRGRGVG